MGYAPPIQDVEEFERTTLELTRAKASAGPYRSQFGAVPYRDKHQAHAGKHEWLIKNVLTRGEQGMLVGASQTGKSFLAFDMGMAIARGVPWFGNKTRQGLVIYHAGESAKGVRDKRLHAYDKANNLVDEYGLPFVLLTLPLDLYSSDEDTNKLITECEHWRTEYPDFPLELLVIDTWAAATPGADENAGKDVSGIRRRCKRIETALGCAVLLVHHKNAAGTKARGHTGMFADVENVLDISLVTTKIAKDELPLKDVNGRKVREAVVTKLKDGEDGKKFRFVLEGVQLGTDEDGEAITSCVIAPPDMGDVDQPEETKAGRPGSRLPQMQYLLLKIITRALADHGQMPAPEGVRVRNDVQVVRKDVVYEAFRQGWHGMEGKAELTASAQRQAWKRGCEALDAAGFIRTNEGWIWRTGKRLPSERDPSRPSPDDVTQVPEQVTDVYGGSPFSETLDGSEPW
ncbi:hypothetical protein MFUR16E_04575 [Methylobacterium fujisawaense]|uniref:AAA family ATPase n=1 Tax=Methylobacterium fujisawaense TaxID=107400 RepID=UPI002F2ECEA4